MNKRINERTNKRYESGDVTRQGYKYVNKRKKWKTQQKEGSQSFNNSLYMGQYSCAQVYLFKYEVLIYETTKICYG